MNGLKNQNFKSILKKKKRLFIGLATIIFMFFILIIVDFPSLIIKICMIGFWGTIIFIIMYSVAFVLRSYKLNLIFNGINKNIKYLTSFFSTGICFIINDLTPGKLGDFAKIAVIKDQEKLNLSESVCGITIERVLDLILLFLISCLAMTYLYFNSYNNYNKSLIILGLNLQFYLVFGTIIIILLMMSLFLLIYKTDTIIQIISKLHAKLAEILGKFIINFKEGMKSFKKHKKELTYVLLLGFITWLIDASIIIIFFYSLGYKLNIIILILAVIISFFSKTLPITPGGWGISENIGALFILLFYPQIPFIEILSIFIIDHLFRSAYISIYGGYSIFRYNFKLKETHELLI